MAETSQSARAFYSAASNIIIDLVGPNGNSLYGNKSLEQLRGEAPDVEMLEFDVAYRRYADGFISAPMQITQQEYEDAFTCMPPVRVRGGGDTESFLLSEMYAADIASIYCRVGDRHFKLRDRCRIEHLSIVAKCRAAMPS